MYKINKDVFHRAGSLLGAMVFMAGLGTSLLPGLASADALNPLTERSLTLSSASPGFHYLDGSGNPTYAPPGSGNNGQKTGETFQFRTSTDSTTTNQLKAFTFQYCTSAAGDCIGPGNAGAGADDATHTNLDIHYTASPVAGTDYKIEYYDDWTVPATPTWVDVSSGWSIATSNVEVNTVSGATKTGRQNYITLTNDTTPIATPALTKFRIKFNASETNYITNPGADAFFVRLNTYNDGSYTDATTNGQIPANVVDGGVTVANVMNDSIQIQTKVLETLSFSVGTTNPDTVDLTSPDVHGPCDAIEANDPLKMGNPVADYSLETGKAYDTYSYWRLSSNSSGGATVYYSGNTLSNTVGDQIDAIGTTAATSNPGMEQFGLTLVDPANETFDTDFTALVGTGNYKTPVLAPLIAAGSYDGGAALGDGDGSIDPDNPGSGMAQFAFDANSLTTPVAMASESDDVVDCVTGKVRYVANIAATTPAGVYTSRINYIAAPEY